MRKALVIRPGRIRDMGDLVKVARAEASKAFGANIAVLPWPVWRDDEGNFVVLIELYNASGVGASRQS